MRVVILVQDSYSESAGSCQLLGSVGFGDHKHDVERGKLLPINGLATGVDGDASRCSLICARRHTKFWWKKYLYLFLYL